jgi:hypothetical protein
LFYSLEIKYFVKVAKKVKQGKSHDRYKPGGTGKAAG